MPTAGLCRVGRLPNFPFCFSRHFQPRRNSTTVLVLNSARLFQKTRRKRSNYGKLVSRFS